MNLIYFLEPFYLVYVLLDFKTFPLKGNYPIIQYFLFLTFDSVDVIL